MPVFSYLAHPVAGATQELRKELQGLDHCQVIVADNEEILILVTDAPDEDTEKDLQAKLKEINALQRLSMTFGHAGK